MIRYHGTMGTNQPHLGEPSLSPSRQLLLLRFSGALLLEESGHLLALFRSLLLRPAVRVSVRVRGRRRVRQTDIARRV